MHSTQNSSVTHQAPIPNERLRRFSVEEYHRMAELGILKADERVELIDGVITTMSPIGSKHATSVRKLNRLFSNALSPTDATIGVQDPIVLDDGTEPEPDISLLKPPEDAYADNHPRPDDVLLVVEVADTSVEEDRTLKLPRYAASDIAEVWLVDINQRKIEVYHTPVGAGADAGYKVRVEYRAGETLSPSAFPNVKLGVTGILPKAEVLS